MNNSSHQNILFDTYSAVKRLTKNDDFTESQAEKIVEHSKEVTTNLVTKNYLNTRLQNLEHSLIIKMFYIQALFAGIIIGIIKLV